MPHVDAAALTALFKAMDPREVASCACVSRHWRGVAASEDLWAAKAAVLEPNDQLRRWDLLPGTLAETLGGRAFLHLRLGTAGSACAQATPARPPARPPARSLWGQLQTVLRLARPAPGGPSEHARGRACSLAATG